MRYLTLAADYTQSALRDDFVGTVVPEEVGLTENLGDRIRDWNARYKAIIPLDEAERGSSPTAELIDALDTEGLLLARAIEAQMSDAKVRYFSEGRLRYVP
ncbi:MAG: hypothetical protein U5K29_12190 [Acidimicrobiales bacterium]|nr:hypothetical protein [Acidimicrobiales bacterium]